ncbi:hypothetical protein AMTRI_Chr08g166620 [Amborella trichopoda]
MTWVFFVLFWHMFFTLTGLVIMRMTVEDLGLRLGVAHVPTSTHRAFLPVLKPTFSRCLPLYSLSTLFPLFFSGFLVVEGLATLLLSYLLFHIISLYFVVIPRD